MKVHLLFVNDTSLHTEVTHAHTWGCLCASASVFKGTSLLFMLFISSTWPVCAEAGCKSPVLWQIYSFNSHILEHIQVVA